MKHTSKILIALLVLATMLMSMAVLTVGAETVTKVLDVEALKTSVDAGTIKLPGDGLANETDIGNGFSIVGSISIEAKTYEVENYTSKNVLKFGGSTQQTTEGDKTVIGKRAIGYTSSVSGNATVKIWWRPGDLGRYLGILEGSGYIQDGKTGYSTDQFVAITETPTSTDAIYSECKFEMKANTKYYIVSPIGDNRIMKIEVVTQAVDSSSCDHSWQEADCDTPKTCSLCGSTEGEALNHDWNGAVVTCTEGRTCQREGCGFEEPAAGHSWGEPEVITQASCEILGEEKYTCGVCSETENRIVPLTHVLSNGVCTECGTSSHVFESKDLTAFKDGDDEDDGKDTTNENPYTDLKTVIGDYFTILFGTTSKIDASEKKWSDYAPGKVNRLNFGSKSTLEANVIKITTNGAAVVKVWWACGDVGRYIAIWDADGKEIDASVAGTVKNDPYSSVLSIPAAGTYYIANPINSNYIFKIEVAEAHVHNYVEDASKRVEPTCIAVGSKTLVCACGEKTEEIPMLTEHPFATEWSKDAENHWYKCTTEGCTEISSKAAHDLVENDQGNNVCSECGYDAGHTCDYSVAKNDETHHWNQCSKCENITEKAEHVWSKDAVTCTEGRSCDCGREEAALGHDYVTGFCSRCLAVDYNYEFVYKFNAATDVTLGADKDPITPITTIYNGYFMVVGDVKQRVKNDAVFALELAKNGGGSLAFTINGTATVTIEFASTGGSNISAVGLYDGRGNMVLADDFRWEVEGTAPVKFTYTLKSGTYYIVSLIENKGYNRGARLHTVEVKTKLCEHTYEAGRVEPTCVLTGGDAQICSKCNHTVITNEEPAKGHSWVGSLCAVCYAANPDFIANNVVVGENKVIVNEHHLVAKGEGQHGKPYEFPFLTIEKAGHYRFVSDKPLTVFIYTTEITAEGADFTPGTGASWNVSVINEAYLEPGTYYIGFIYLDGIGEYNVKVEEYTPHEHKFENGKCECGESDPNYVPPVEPQPEPELNFFQKIWQAILAFFQKILGFFKK